MAAIDVSGTCETSAPAGLNRYLLGGDIRDDPTHRVTVVQADDIFAARFVGLASAIAAPGRDIAVTCRRG